MKKTSMQFFLTCSIALLASIAMIGCSDSNTDEPNQNTGPITPKVGSSYSYNQHYKDSSTTVDEGDGSLTSYIIASDSTFQGKTHVIFSANQVDTIIYMYESNGDISFYVPEFSGTIAGVNATVQNPSPWIRLPFGSKSTNVTLFPNDSTTVTTPVGPQTLDVTGIADYTGEDSVLLADNTTLSGPSARMTIIVQGRGIFSSIKLTAKRTLSFNNSIGSFFRTVSDNTIPPITLIGTPGEHNVTTTVLVSYSLTK